MKRPRASARPRRPGKYAGVQYAALPYRLGDEVEILLVTSRETRRWVIPKGWPMKGLKPHATAAREAREEAGVIGKVGKAAIGRYGYVKLLKNGAPLDCTVEVFPLEVTSHRVKWLEKGQRTLHWFTVEEAAEAVHEPELQDLIEAFGRTLTESARYASSSMSQ